MALKTVGLLAVMAQSGPAHPGARGLAASGLRRGAGRHRRRAEPRAVALDVLLAHPAGLARSSPKATEQSLVLLDELGAGTDPAEGAALGRAILDELDSIGCRAIVTTHIGDLKTYAFTNPQGRERGGRVRPRDPPARATGCTSATSASRTPCRSPGGSNLPEHLVGRAEALPRADGAASASPSWRSSRSSARRPRTRARPPCTAQAEAERSREALDQRLADLQRRPSSDDRMAEARARLQPGDRVVVPRFGYDRPGRVVKLDPRKKTAVVAIGQMTVGRRDRRADPPGGANLARRGPGGLDPAQGIASPVVPVPGRVRERLTALRNGQRPVIPHCPSTTIGARRRADAGVPTGG